MVVEVREALGVAGVELGRRGVQPEDVEQRRVRVACIADVGDAGGHGGPVGVGRAQQPVQATQERAVLAAVDPADPGEGRRRQDPVGLRADADGGQRATAADVVQEEAAGGAHGRVGERGAHHRLHEVAERRGPQHRLHRPGLGRVHAPGARDAGEERGVDAQRLREPLPVGPVLGARRLQRVEGRVRVVRARVARAVALGVVRRRALRDQGEAAAAAGVVAQELLDEPAPLLRPGAEAHAGHEDPVEARRSLLRRQRDGERHAPLDRAVEVGEPEQLVGHDEVVAVAAQPLALGGGRVGADEEG